MASGGVLEAEQARVYIESTLGVFLKSPRFPIRGINQQFGVYDENMEFVGDVTAGGRLFTKSELEEKVRRLF